MPEKTGLELAADLKLSDSKARVIVLTTFARPGYLRRALDAGARGYLLKEPPASEIAEAIRRVHSGLRAVDPALAAEAWSADEDPLSDRRTPDPSTRRRRSLLRRDRHRTPPLRRHRP
jgi:two-component system response regulator DesR